MDRTPKLLFFCLLFASSLELLRPTTLFYTVLPTAFTDVITYALLATLCLYAIKKHSEIHTPRYALITFLGISTIYLVHFATETPTMYELKNTVFVIIASIAIIFIIPAIIKPKTLLYQLVAFSTVTAVLGIPATVLGEFGPIGTWQPRSQIAGLKIHEITSVFINPNSFALLTGIGVIASISLYTICDRPAYIVAASLNLAALIASNGRAALVATVFAATLYLMWTRYGVTPIKLTVTVTGTAATYFFAVRAGLLPGPSIFDQLYFAGRIQLWTAASEVAQHRPLFGHGYQRVPQLIQPYLTESLKGRGVHNALFYYFITSGYVGLILYVYLIGRTVFHSINALSTRSDMAVFSIWMLLLVVHVFESLTVFRPTLFRMLMGLTLGYQLYNLAARSHTAEGDTLSHGSNHLVNTTVTYQKSENT